MPSKSAARRLQDIVDNCDAIVRYIASMDEDGFVTDQKTRDAVERCLQRISEAAVKIGFDAEAFAPNQP